MIFDKNGHSRFFIGWPKSLNLKLILDLFFRIILIFCSDADEVGFFES